MNFPAKLETEVLLREGTDLYRNLRRKTPEVTDILVPSSSLEEPPLVVTPELWGHEFIFGERTIASPQGCRIQLSPDEKIQRVCIHIYIKS